MALAGSNLHDHASQLDVTDASIDEVDTVSNGSDRGRVYMEEQATRLQHGDNGANVAIPNAEQSIIVHEQSQPPWVPSPRRHEVCSYTDNEAEARVPPLAPAEEDSLVPSGIGEEVRGHMKRKVRRTIRRFFLDGQAYYRGHHIVTGTQLAAFFGQATVQRVWNPARGGRRQTGEEEEITADLFLTARGNMRPGKANGPEDTIVTEMLKELPFETMYLSKEDARF